MKARTLFAAAGVAGLVGALAAAPGVVSQQPQAPRVIVYKTPT